MKACPQCKERFGDADEFCPHHGHRLVPIAITDKEDRGNYDRLIGTTLDGRYVVDGKLGEGGMGVVFKAHHKVIEKPVAIKVLRRDLARDAAVVQRFLQEAKAASRIGHPNIVDVIDFNRLDDGAAYQVMEFMNGKTLARVLRETGGRMPLTRCLPIVFQMARALAAAHEKGIVHRDLKPDNVFLLLQDGRADHVKIGDFGIAKILDQQQQGRETPRLTKVGAIFGTPDYMAPEQAAGRADIDQRVDVYALGTILYEMVVGHVPHRSDNPLSVLTMQLLDPIIPPRQAAMGVELSDDLERVIMKALAKERDQRYGGMPDFIMALEAAAGGIPLEIPISGTGPMPIIRAAQTPPARAVSALSPTAAMPPAQPPPPSAPPVVFTAKASHPEVVGPSKSAEQAAAHAERRGGRPLLLFGVIIVAVAAAVVAIGLYLGRDDAGGTPPDGPLTVVTVTPDAARAAAPADAAPVAVVRDAAGPPSRRDAGSLALRRPDAGVRTVLPAEKKTITVTLVTEPPEGVLYQEGRELADHSVVKGLEGTRGTVTCKMYRRETGKVVFTFDRDKTVVCKMAELKNPFGEPPPP